VHRAGAHLDVEGLLQETIEARLRNDPGELARSLRRVAEAGWRLTGASDHLVSEALYLQDPEGNGIEIYRDRPREEWRTGPGGELAPRIARGASRAIGRRRRHGDQRCQPRKGHGSLTRSMATTTIAAPASIDRA
jgi:hypothetical protein